MSKTPYVCHSCGKPGHFRRDCPSNKDKVRKANVARKKSKQFIFVAGSKQTTPVWYLDTGASFHMIKDLKYLQNFIQEPETIYVADGRKLSSPGHGTLLMRNAFGNQVTLSKVYFIPSLSSNLISVSALDKHGTRLSVYNSKARIISKTGDTVLTASLSSGNLYELNCEGVLPEKSQLAMAVKFKDAPEALPLEVWHRRLGHVNLRDIQKLSQCVKGLALSTDTAPQCIHCIQGKQTQQS
jgi:hypothetical protein